MPTLSVSAIVQAFIALLTPLLPFLGSQAEATTERMETIPEADIRKLCKGMSEADTETAIALGHTMSHAMANFTVFVASRGKVTGA